MKKIVFALLAACLLAACATSGVKIDMSQVDQLKPGVSTIADAERLFGPPQSQTTHTDGTTMLGYGNGHEQMGLSSFLPIGHGPSTQTQSLALIFDSHGRYLKSWSQATSN